MGPQVAHADGGMAPLTAMGGMRKVKHARGRQVVSVMGIGGAHRHGRVGAGDGSNAAVHDCRVVEIVPEKLALAELILIDPFPLVWLFRLVVGFPVPSIHQLAVGGFDQT